MPTIQKRSAGEEFIHGVGTVARGESVDVGAETAEYLVEEDGTYEYAENAESVAESDADTGTDEDTKLDGDVLDALKSGVCPWCEDYEGDHVGQHASSAHPDKWDAYAEEV